MNETSICVSNPGEAYVTPPAMPPLAPSTATSAAPVPTNAKDESNRNCGEWYNVVEGDYCNLVTIKYGISLSDFIFLNPSINSNCTNLLFGINYCVQPVGDSKYYISSVGLLVTEDSQYLLWPTGLPYTWTHRLTLHQGHLHAHQRYVRDTHVYAPSSRH